MLTSLHWRPCSESAVIVRLYHITPFNILTKTLTGGSHTSTHLSSDIPSPDPPPLSTSTPFPMQASLSESQLLSKGIGGHGLFAQTGRLSMASGTLDGLNQLDLSFLFTPSSTRERQVPPHISASSATIRVLSSVGEIGGVATGPPTLSSTASTTYLKIMVEVPPSTSVMSPAVIT